MTANSANAVYNTYIDGTANITTITNSPAFASKGNYFGISAEVNLSLPQIFDQNNNPVVGTADSTSDFIGVEKLSGQVMTLRDNFQVSYQSYSNDALI